MLTANDAHAKSDAVPVTPEMAMNAVTNTLEDPGAVPGVSTIAGGSGVVRSTCIHGDELGSTERMRCGLFREWQHSDAPKTISANDNVALAVAA